MRNYTKKNLSLIELCERGELLEEIMYASAASNIHRLSTIHFIEHCIARFNLIKPKAQKNEEWIEKRKEILIVENCFHLRSFDESAFEI